MMCLCCFLAVPKMVIAPSTLWVIRLKSSYGYAGACLYLLHCTCVYVRVRLEEGEQICLMCLY